LFEGVLKYVALLKVQHCNCQNLMADVELLNVNRARHFIAYTLENDLQVKANRSRAGSLLTRSLCANDDIDYVEFPAEKFDKMITFFTENDRQVHYQERDTVGVYSIVRLLGELRRLLRDYSSGTAGPMQIGGHSMASPRVVLRDSDSEGDNQKVPVPNLPLRGSSFAFRGGYAGGVAGARDLATKEPRKDEPPNLTGGSGEDVSSAVS